MRDAERPEQSVCLIHLSVFSPQVPPNNYEKEIDLGSETYVDGKLFRLVFSTVDIHSGGDMRCNHQSVTKRRRVRPAQERMKIN